MEFFVVLKIIFVNEYSFLYPFLGNIFNLIFDEHFMLGKISKQILSLEESQSMKNSMQFRSEIVNPFFNNYRLLFVDAGCMSSDTDVTIYFTLLILFRLLFFIDFHDFIQGILVLSIY